MLELFENYLRTILELTIGSRGLEELLDVRQLYEYNLSLNSERNFS